MNRAGCNYGELSRLELFERARADDGDGDEGKPQGDPALRGMLQALAALSPEADPAVPLPLLEAVLGRPLSKLSQAEQALIEPHKGQLEFVKPALRALLLETAPAALHERALDYNLGTPEGRSRRFRTLYHAKEARAFERLLPPLEEDPSRLALLPGLWTEAAAWPEAARVRLAYVVVRYRAVLSAYTHPEAQDALAVLAASADQ